MTKSKSGGTEAVTQYAESSSDARVKVLKLGYDQVIWVSPEDEKDTLSSTSEQLVSSDNQ